MKYTNRLYLILHPNKALIGSQYSPEELARHYTVGPTRFYKGKVIFAEIDIEFRNPYFNIDNSLANLEPHENGRPKATKFISSYRVLEHIDISAIKNLYITTPEGYCLELEEGVYSEEGNKKNLRIYVEIAPLRMLVLSRYNFSDFGVFITSPDNPIGAPKFFYTQLDLNIQEFLRDSEQNPFLLPPIATLHPSILRNAINELKSMRDKNNKGLSLQNGFDTISYKLIKKGFMFVSHEDNKFFPMPSIQEIEKKNFKFWNSM